MKIILPQAPHLKIDFPDDVEVVYHNERQPLPAEHGDAEACVLWGIHPATGDFVAQLPRVRWFQTLAAGPDGLLNSPLAEGTVVTIGTGFHDRTVAEHALGLALALAREFPQAWQGQQRHEWLPLGRPEVLHTGRRVKTTVGAKVVVWGFGAIGQQIGRVFAACGARVVGVARSAGMRAGFTVVASEQLLDEVADADFLVMVLPATERTKLVLNARVLTALPSRSHVINVGRGSTVDEDALLWALQSGEISGAALDVTATEPLPSDSPLWDAPNLFVTPHCAGGRPEGAEERILHNFLAWRDGRWQDLIHRVRP